MPVFAFVAALALAPALCAAADGEQVLLSPTPTTRKSGGYDDMGSDELLRLQNENEQLLAEKAIVAAEADKWNAKLKDILLKQTHLEEKIVRAQTRAEEEARASACGADEIH